MDAIECEAMLIRHHAVMTNGPLGWEGLCHVMIPSEALLSASMQMARERGPTNVAQRLVRPDKVKRRVSKRETRPRTETLDDMLARMR